MTKSNVLFIGMDVHKSSIEIALADDGANGEVRRYGRIGGTLDALKKTLRNWYPRTKRSISAMRPGHVGDCASCAVIKYVQDLITHQDKRGICLCNKPQTTRVMECGSAATVGRTLEDVM